MEWKWTFCLLTIGFMGLIMPIEGKEVLAFGGSLRKDSYNKKLAKEAADAAKELGANVTYIDLKEYPIPLYDEDLERSDGMPPNAKKIRDLMLKSDAIIISTPEYNGSLPAVLKNVIDWSSRNEKGEGSRDAFKGKTFAIFSASPGSGGGKKAASQLKEIIERIGGTVIEEQLSISEAYEAFDQEGKLKNSKQENALKSEVKTLLQKS